MKKKKGYYKGIEKEMYCYFISYSGEGAPSFSKFARHKGILLKTLRSYRKHKKFEDAYIECSDIRRDYLTDQALAKKFDGSFVKYLLSEEDEENVADDINFRLEIV